MADMRSLLRTPGVSSFFFLIVIIFQIKLIDYDLGLTEASYLLACLALPWSWFLGLVIPLHDNNTGQLDMNLKLAKQNKHRNVIKYQ